MAGIQSRNSMKIDAVKSLSSFFEEQSDNSVLTELDLRNLGFTKDSLHALALGLKKNSVLVQLNLEGNLISDGIQWIASSLPHTLRSLKLSNNPITHKQLKLFLECLKEPHRLASLELASTKMKINSLMAIL